MLNEKNIEWLLHSDPWIEYRTRVDLLEQSENDARVKQARRAMLADSKIQALITELLDWPGTVLNSHRSASQPFHKLTFISDLGLNVNDAPVRQITRRVMEHQSEQGPFQLPTNVPTHFGGSGKDEWAWALCDAPIIVYALMKMGLGNNRRVQTAIQHLDGLARDNGWPCTVSPELGNFRGPGRKDDPCPYATLVMLKMLAQVPELSEGQSARSGAETLLTLWQNSRLVHPYMFFMGTDFRKLKAPLFWYDILHVVEVLSQFKWVRKDRRFKEMLNTLTSKSDVDGRFIPESVWVAWKAWDFSQKKLPSQGLTYFIERIQKRMELQPG